MGLEEIINDRVSFGNFQIRCFLILCLIDMNDGVELVLSSLLNPIIKASFPGVTNSYVSSLASIFYAGILVGSLSSGLLSDKYGRRRLIIYGSIVQIGVSALFYLVYSLEVMLVLRFMYGFSFGFTVAITSTMFAEISPQKYRGKGVLLINFCISLGKIYAVLLGYVFIEQDLKDTNWKLMMLCGGLPNVIVFIGSYFILEESPRFLLANQRYDEGFDTLNKMIEINHGNNNESPLTLDEKVYLRSEFTSARLTTSNHNHMSYNALFSEQYKAIVLGLASCWIIINFCYYGQLVIEAMHITDNKGGLNLSKYFFTIFGQFPSLILSMYLIDHPDFGRKRSLIIFFLAGGAFHLLFAATQLTIMGSVARFFMKDVFQILYPLTTESFETKIRAKGFGFCSGSGRIGAIIMPFILVPLDQTHRSLTYVIFFALFMLAAYLVFKFVQQTLNKKLDESQVQMLTLQQRKAVNF